MTKLYRYEGYSQGGIVEVYHVSCVTYNIIRTTPKGWWIQGDTWVSNSAKKRYAYPSKEEALASFKKRKERQIKILEAQIKMAKGCLQTAIEGKERE